MRPRAGIPAFRRYLADMSSIADSELVPDATYAGERWFQQLLEFAPDAIIGVDRKGRIVFANRRVEALFGYAQDDLAGQSVEMLVPAALRRGHRARREAFTRAPRTREMGESIDLRALRKDGTEFPCEVSLAQIDTPNGPVAVAAIRDMSHRRRMELLLRREHVRRSEMELRRVEEERQELAQRVYIDPLTDLHNRAYLDDLLEAGWPDAEPLELVGVVMVDVDHFKQINDTYGHQVGDAVLTAVAGRLSRAIRRRDEIARWGGEEFCIILKGIADRSALLQRAEELRTAICARPVGDGAHTIDVTVSVGAVAVPGTTPDPAAAVSRADEALYEAKHAGRNCTRIAPKA